MSSHDLFTGKDARYQIKRSWCSVTSERSGDIVDIDLAVEIDLPEGSVLRIIRTVSGRNQIVISLKVIQYKEEKRDEQQAEERSQEAQEEQGTHEQSP